MPTIKTDNGVIRFKTYPLYLGVKRIDKQIAKENLLLLKKELDAVGLTFGLIAGTLLGAVREHDFIEHDEDIDLFLLEESKVAFMNNLPRLIDCGFEIARYDRRGLLSIIRKGEYIDLYFFSNHSKGVRTCSGWLIPETFLIQLAQFEFLDTLFYAPKDYLGLLEYEYGKSWITPIPYTDFNIPKWKIKLFEWKEKIKDSLPDRLYFFLARKAEKTMIERYQSRIDNYFRDSSL